jgi:DNA polymerase-1
MTILAIDFMNQAHRARSGFQLGPAPVVFNFFRQFKALVDQFKPTRVYVALEGRPVHRYEALGDYKANRKVEADDPRAKELEKFFKQKDIIVDLLQKHFPVSVVRHATSECDDTLANLMKRSSSAVDWVLVSSDTDFIQLLQDHSNLKLYNPVQKKFVEAPEYDYVVWKALRGDPSDNIPGVPGIGDKTAEKIALDPALFREHVSNPDMELIFSRNYDLIRFKEWTSVEADEMTSSSPIKNWDAVKDVFAGYGFSSVVKDGSWQKFTSAFDNLWGNQ